MAMMPLEKKMVLRVGSCGGADRWSQSHVGMSARALKAVHVAAASKTRSTHASILDFGFLMALFHPSRFSRGERVCGEEGASVAARVVNVIKGR